MYWFPISIDEATIRRTCGHFARILEDIDLNEEFPEQFLVPKRGMLSLYRLYLKDYLISDLVAKQKDNLQGQQTEVSDTSLEEITAGYSDCDSMPPVMEINEGNHLDVLQQDKGGQE
ncbi:unnamed protein product [Sphenostylis stenocarpa]|uniref:Uncharacterized protein n=1 Tax=Sphenostylis stenocarpa TaxID=92480 RepID=A0AA86VDW7_9FABA|nr:unnamed protein product [Sphenostylis stenocarpa]